MVKVFFDEELNVWLWNVSGVSAMKGLTSEEEHSNVRATVCSTNHS